MHFGIFLEERRRGVSEGATLRETIELADAGEAGGLDGVWLGEIHFNGNRSIQSAPLALASFMAARTRRIRVGIAVQVLPLGNPLRIAEEAATVDQLSEGRLDFGIGRSGSARTYDLLGVPYGESQARFLESLEVIRLAWQGKPFSYDGKFYRVRDVTVSPTPYQVPHPPLRMAANSPETFPQVARLGLPLFIGLRDLDIPAAARPSEDVPGHLARVGAARRSGRVPAHPGVRGPDRGGRARGAAGGHDLLLPAAHRADPRPASAAATPARGTAGRSWRTGSPRCRTTRCSKTRVAFGTAASLRERLGEIAEDLGLSGIVAELNPSGLLSLDQMRRTLDILTREVIPTFR